MCNECAYCGSLTDPLRLDDRDQLTCKDCCEDEDSFYGMTTLDEWQADQREEAFMRADWLMQVRRDNLMEGRA